MTASMAGGIHKHYASVSEWWSGYAECLEGDGAAADTENLVLKSTALWIQLKRDRADICAEMTVAEFKDVLCLIVPSANIVRARGKGGGVEVLRYRVRGTAENPDKASAVVVATECLDTVLSYFHAILLKMLAGAKGLIDANMAFTNRFALTMRISCRVSPYSLKIVSKPRAEAIRVEWYRVKPLASNTNIHFSPWLFSKTSR